MSKSKSHIAKLAKLVVEFSESHQTSIEYLMQFDEFSNSFFACISKRSGTSMKEETSSQEPISDIKAQANCIDVLSFSLEIEVNPCSSISLCQLTNYISGENKSRHSVRVCDHEFYLQVINEGVLIYDVFDLSTKGKSHDLHTSSGVDTLLDGLEQFKHLVRGVYDNIFISPIVVRSLGADAIGTYPAISSEQFIDLYDS
ncbi:MAG: hypothetical protein ACJAV1_003612 [Paraglaciecola sp.]|jgi:hypothetical protein